MRQARHSTQTLSQAVLLALLGTSAGVHAQQVLPDRRVTFGLDAPGATAVSVSGDWVTHGRGSGGALSRDATGHWSITVGPLVPDFYSYSFTVDGLHVVDPANPMIKPGTRTTDSMFEVPGPEAAYEATAQVAHGDLRSVWYFAKTLGQMRRMQVYTPPGYDTTHARYPVLYLIGGGGDDDAAWSTIGRAGFILDNLLASHRIVPMIVVMPNGNLSVPDIAPLQFGAPNLSPAAIAARMATLTALHERFAQELTQDIVPQVERRFRVKADHNDRAVAGLAMGAAEALTVTASQPAIFAYLGVFSDGLQQGAHASNPPDFEQRYAAFFADPARSNASLRLLWIAAGRDDVTIEDGPKRLTDLLTAHGIKYELHPSDGGHDWINWRLYLAEFTQRLFQTRPHAP